MAADVRDPKYIEATRTSGYTFRSTDIGVVMDVMIHDLDIVLSLAKSSVEDVQALGISVLGGHEDMATARLTFASGCVAQLDGLARELSAEADDVDLHVAGQCFDQLRDARSDGREAERRGACGANSGPTSFRPTSGRTGKSTCSTELLVRSQRDAQPVNAIQEEQRDFVAAVRTGKAPRVDGAAGRDAIAVAEMILERIEEHAWDGTPAGRHGPFAMPALPIIAGTTQPAVDRHERRRAG